MNPNRWPLMILLLTTVVSVTLGCQKKSSKSEGIKSSRCARGGCGVRMGNAQGSVPQVGSQVFQGTNNSGRTGTYSAVDGIYWGQVHKGQYSQSQFDEGVRGFVSANINPWGDTAELGYVSGDVNQDTGVFFWGDVALVQGVFNPMGGAASGQIHLASAQLRIVVWDAFAGLVDASGQTVPEYHVQISGASSGFVSGNTATIRFEDQFGWVELKGQFDQQYFQGYVHYKNKQFWDGQSHQGFSGSEGILGSFFVPTCGFFRCQ